MVPHHFVFKRIRNHREVQACRFRENRKKKEKTKRLSSLAHEASYNQATMHLS